MAQGNSNQNQTPIESAYRFGDFELYPSERLLKRKGESVLLPPKSFDALLCLVGKADRLVTKRELTAILWPSTFVSEANLTNMIVSLRKILGRHAIVTVSKHGYRFATPVESAPALPEFLASEPGIGRTTYETFARAKELTAQRSLESMTSARGLYWICLAENPEFAPAWAWLGRCCWFLGKFGSNTSTDTDLALSAFRRAFAIDPDLACAHQFYTPVEVDTGQSLSALVRLLERTQRHPGDAQTFAGLVQVFRFRGLLHESTRANERATNLDPTVITSVPHTLFLSGDYSGCIDSYGGRAAYYLDAAAWAALGDERRARTLLRERLGRMSLSPWMGGLMGSLCALLEDKVEEAVRHIQSTCTANEPETLIYLARHYSRMGLADCAIESLRSAAQGGFICSPYTLNTDVWLSAVRSHPEFDSLLHMEQEQVDRTQSVVERFTLQYAY
jgi:DNA-binding winged helix-turn-helix (wHTH) protein